MRSVTGRSAITEHSSVTATLGKCKHLLSLVGASASLTRQAVLPAVPSRKEAFPTEKHENRRTGASPRLTAPKGLADFRFAVCRRRMTVTEHLTFLTVRGRTGAVPSFLVPKTAGRCSDTPEGIFPLVTDGRLCYHDMRQHHIHRPADGG